MTLEQKETDTSTSIEFLAESVGDPNFLNTIITGDESWIYAYDEATKVQSRPWICEGKTQPKKAQMAGNINLKVLLILFFDLEGVAYHEYVSQGKTVTAITTSKLFYV